MEGLVGVILFINIYGFYAMYQDKQYAKRNQWRISERKLLLISFFFGSIGVLASMYMFRHKTKHWQFVYGVPMMLVLQVGIVSWYVLR